MLNWANRFSISVFLDSNGYDNIAYSKYECLLAVDPIQTISAENSKDVLSSIHQWHKTNRDWLFGHINYDYKNRLFKKLSSSHLSNFEFSEIHFFCPKVVCYITSDKTELCIQSIGILPEEVWDAIKNASSLQQELPNIQFKKKIGRSEYLGKIERLQKHIKDGDCYEINYCNEGYAEKVAIDPLSAFLKLNKISPAPFAGYYKCNEQYLICSSPERYLCKWDSKIISQPIKGTAKRSEDKEDDERLKNNLQNSKKDRAENVMIVDLTRNDLSRSCVVGSIEVEELFGIYSFPKVHQMISTITGVLDDDTPFTDAIRYSFPMGSMTGAPKMKVMELIEQYESSKRELFSGSIGYISPDANFDFNVIIRSLFYNAKTNYLSYQTGGAITYDSNAEQEWDEMELKAYNLEKIFRR